MVISARIWLLFGNYISSSFQLQFNLLKPGGFFTYHQFQHPKILHDIRLALSVLYGSQNRQRPSLYTWLFISPSGISELDCPTTKTDTAERSISIGRESLQVFFVLGALAYFQVPPLGGSRDEKWRSQ